MVLIHTLGIVLEPESCNDDLGRTDKQGLYKQGYSNHHYMILSPRIFPGCGLKPYADIKLIFLYIIR